MSRDKVYTTSFHLTEWTLVTLHWILVDFWAYFHYSCTLVESRLVGHGLPPDLKGLWGQEGTAALFCYTVTEDIRR